MMDALGCDLDTVTGTVYSRTLGWQLPTARLPAGHLAWDLKAGLSDLRGYRQFEAFSGQVSVKAETKDKHKHAHGSDDHMLSSHSVLSSGPPTTCHSTVLQNMCEEKGVDTVASTVAPHVRHGHSVSIASSGVEAAVRTAAPHETRACHSIDIVVEGVEAVVSTAAPHVKHYHGIDVVSESVEAVHRTAARQENQDCSVENLGAGQSVSMLRTAPNDRGGDCRHGEPPYRRGRGGDSRGGDLPAFGPCPETTSTSPRSDPHLQRRLPQTGMTPLRKPPARCERCWYRPRYGNCTRCRRNICLECVGGWVDGRILCWV